MAIATAGASSYAQHPSAIRPVVRRRNRAPGFDGARRPCFAAGCARRVRHRYRSRLLALVVAVVEHDAGDGIRTLARAEGHREREDGAAGREEGTFSNEAVSKSSSDFDSGGPHHRSSHTDQSGLRRAPTRSDVRAVVPTWRTDANGWSVASGASGTSGRCCFVISRSAVRVRSQAPIESTTYSGLAG